MEDGNQPIAVVGSPNTTTEVSIDIQDEFLEQPILGSLVQFRLTPKKRDGTEQDVVVMGQVSDIETTNRWHEDPSMKNYLKLHGRLPNLTEVGDVTTGTIHIIGAYSRESDGQGSTVFKRHRLSIPAKSGIPVHFADKETISSIMDAEFSEGKVGYLGRFYGSGDAPAPAYIKHFGHHDEGGSGEAYMGGVFGVPGTGKSVLAASLDALWARHPEMGMIFLDPQSEFAGNKFASGTGFQFDFHKMLQITTSGKFDPQRDIYSIDQLQLDGVTLFVNLLYKKGFFKQLGISSAKANECYQDIIDSLEKIRQRDQGKQKRWDPSKRLEDIQQNYPDLYEEVRDAVIQACANVYASSSRDNKAEEFTNNWESSHVPTKDRWDSVVSFFETRSRNGVTRKKLPELVKEIIRNGKKVIIDLDPSQLRTGNEDSGTEESLKLFIMEFVFRKISQASHEMFKSEDANANCLIVLDEAGRFIPQSSGDNKDLERIGGYIENKVKELRKYGVGFQFITQTLTEIKKEVFRSLHYRVYGVGMSVGADANHIEDKEGRKNFQTYSTLPDPKLSGVYSFMVCGTLVAMGTTGKPMFIEGFESDDEILRENGYPTTGAGESVGDDSSSIDDSDRDFDPFSDDPDPWDEPEQITNEPF